MKRAFVLVLIGCAMTTVARAQQNGSNELPAAPPPPETAAPATVNTAPHGSVPTNASAQENLGPREVPVDPNAPAPDANPAGTAQPAAGDTQGARHDQIGAREMPLEADTVDARVHRRVAEFGDRHQQRQRLMASYDRAGSSEPGLGRFADPRKVQVQLSDELDREQTSEELSGDFAEQARSVQARAKALVDFVAKRRQTLNDLNKKSGEARREDLEVALANLARQPLSPETMAQMREIDRRLSEAERNEKDLPSQLSQAQQEADDAGAELSKLHELQQAYEKESKAYLADALSARQNRLRLAGKLEYFIARAQAEDELEQGRKSLEAAQHLSASPDVESLLRGSGSATKSDADLQQLRDCIRDSGDVKGCRQIIHQE